MIVSETGPSTAFSWLPAFLAFIKRRRYVLILPTLAGLVAGLIGYASTPFSYMSEAVVALDNRRVQALPTETVVSPLPQDSPVLRTELDVISSRTMAERVVDQLERDGVAIGGENPGRTILADVWRATAQWLEASAEPGAPAPEREGFADERQKIDYLRENLHVSNDGRSFTIFLSFRSADSEFAAKVANGYARSYLDHQIEVQRSATRRVSDWLGETLVSLRADLEDSEQASEDFRQQAGLVETDGKTLQAQRVSALNGELIASRAALSETRARLDTVRELASEGDLPALAEVLTSETIQALRIEQAGLERRLDELRGSGALKSSQIAMLETEMTSLGQQIDREVRKVVESLSNEIAIANRKRTSLEAALREAQGELAKANRAEVAMAQLEREATANRTIYESYLVRYKQTIEQDGFAAPEAQIISLAEPAAARASPRLATWLLFGIGFGGSAAVAGAIYREATDRRFRLSEAIQSATGVPVVGAMPHLTRAEKLRASEDAQYAASVFGRVLTLLRMLLRASPERRQSAAVALTSAFEGEGTTTLAVGLARSAAAVGISTVLVDANLRNPGLEAAFGVQASSYIDEIMDRSRRPSELVQQDPRSSLRFLAARNSAVSADMLFASRRFEALIADLKLHFDLVLIDAPDLDSAPDALEIASIADRTLFITRFDTRRLQQVIAAIGSIASCGRAPDGVVLNRVDRHSYGEVSKRSVRRPAMPAGRAAASGESA